MHMTVTTKQLLGTGAIAASALLTATQGAPAMASITPSNSICPVSAKQDGPWYPSVVAFEHFDSGRMHTFRCATFSGSMTGRNVVRANKLAQNYPTPYNLVLRKPSEGYIYGGAYGDYPGAPGSFVAKFDPHSNKQVWRTQLFDAAEHPSTWNYPGVVAVHRNGYVYVVYGTTLAKLDSQTGRVLGTTALPYSGNQADTSYNGFDAFSDGTLVMKTVSRQAGCTEQGFSAFLKCRNPTDVPRSLIAVVNPRTMKLLAQAQAPEPIGGRLTTTSYTGVDRLYLPGSKNVFRYDWQDGKLTLDIHWGPVPYLKPGQSTAPAVAVVGKWVVLQTNALPTSTPMSLVAISQSHGTVSRVDPFASMQLPFQKSFLPSMVTADPENSRAYVIDAGAGEVGAFSLDQRSGVLTPLWKARQRTLNFSTLIGPKAHRVFIATAVPAPTLQGLQNYKTEAVVFRSAATGKELARSRQLPKMTTGALVTPGDDGRIYFLGLGGDIFRLSIRPAG